MALEFPSAPVRGDTYDAYTFDGEKWICGPLPPPSWVPDGAQFYFDFKNDPPRGWDGSAEIDADGFAALLGNDPGNSYCAGSNYNKALIIPGVGYDYLSDIVLSGNMAFSVLGALKAMVEDGMTVVFTGQIDPAYLDPWITFANTFEDYAELWAYTQWNELEAYSTRDQLFLMEGVLDYVAGEFRPNRIAFTFTALRWEIAVNGSVAMGAVLNPTFDTPNGPLDMFYVDAAPIETLAFYAPLPDITGLSELSQLPAAARGAPSRPPSGIAPRRRDGKHPTKHRGEK